VSETVERMIEAYNGPPAGYAFVASPWQSSPAPWSSRPEPADYAEACAQLAAQGLLLETRTRIVNDARVNAILRAPPEMLDALARALQIGAYGPLEPKPVVADELFVVDVGTHEEDGRHLGGPFKSVEVATLALDEVAQNSDEDRVLAIWRKGEVAYVKMGRAVDLRAVMAR